GHPTGHPTGRRATRHRRVHRHPHRRLRRRLGQTGFGHTVDRLTQLADDRGLELGDEVEVRVLGELQVCELPEELAELLLHRVRLPRTTGHGSTPRWGAVTPTRCSPRHARAGPPST